MHGDENDKKVNIGPGFGEVTKAIINKGELKIYGIIKIVRAYLSSSVNNTSSILNLDNTPAWEKGDKLVIASSSSKAKEYEMVTIDSISLNTVTIKEKLFFFHQSKKMFANFLYFKGEVINLTRNVIIEGKGDGPLGCVIINPIFKDPDNPSNLIHGEMDLQNVEIRKCGQYSENLAAVNIISSDPSYSPSSTRKIQYSSIHSLYGKGVYFKNINSSDFSYNNIFDSVEKAVYVEESTNINILKNSIIKVRPWNSDPDSFEVNYGIYIQSFLSSDQTNIDLKSNRVSSIEKFGIAYFAPGYNCTFNLKNLISHFNYNIAHSSDIGWLGVKTVDTLCVKFGHFNGYKNRNLGFLYLGDNVNLIIENIFLSDNRAAISTSMGLKNTEQPTVTLQDSEIYGRYLPSETSFYQYKEDCRTDGVILSSFSIGEVDYNFTKASLPLYQPVSEKIISGTQYFENVEFINFNHTECQGLAEVFNSYAFVVKDVYNTIPSSVYLNDTSLDFSKRETILFNYSFLYKSGSFCDLNKCSGFKNILFYDYSVLLTTQKNLKHTIFYNEDKTINDPDCEIESETKVAKCSKAMSQIFIEQVDATLTEKLFPIQINVMDAINKETIITHSINGNDQSAGIVKTGNTNQLLFHQNLDTNIKMRLKSFDSKDYAFFLVNIDDSLSVSVHRNQKMIPPKTYYSSAPELQNDFLHFCGNNSVDNQNNQLKLYLDGSDTCSISIRFMKALKTSIKLNADLSTFIDNDGVSSVTEFIYTSLNLQKCSNSVSVLKVEGENPLIIHFEIQQIERVQDQEAELKKLYCKLGRELNNTRMISKYAIIENLGTPTLYLGKGHKKKFYDPCVMNSHDDIICIEFEENKQNCKVCRSDYHLNLSKFENENKKCFSEKKYNCKTNILNEKMCETCNDSDYLDKTDYACKPLAKVLFCKVYEKYSNKCKYCETNKFVKDNECVSTTSVITDCMYYNSFTTCGQCKDGFYTDNGLKCKEGSLPGCLVFESENVCIHSDYFYRLSNGKPKYMTGCETLNLDNPSDCEKCRNQDYYLDNSKTCTLRTERPNCTDYEPKSDNCRKCQEYFWVDDRGVCQNHTPVENCIDYEKYENKCRRCNSLTFYSKNDEVCVPLTIKIENCHIYLDDGVCETCIQNYLPKSGACVLGEIEGCMNYKTFDQCMECYDPYYLETDKFHCKRYDDDLNCKPKQPNQQSNKHPNKNECIECSLHQMLNDQKKCVNIPGCERFEKNSNYCEVCENKYYLDKSNKKCILRTALYCEEQQPNKDECVKCEPQFYLDSFDSNICKPHKNVENCSNYHRFENICVSCLSEFYLNENKCEPIHKSVTNCKEYSDYKNCIKCFDEFYLENNKCNEGNIPHCIEYHSKDICLSCDNDHFMQNWDCYKYSSDLLCKVYSDNKDECESCYKGFLKTKKNKCKEIKNCQRYSQNNQGCDLCNNGFYMDTVKNECTEQTNKTCKTYELESDMCETCDDGFYLDMNNSFTCKKRNTLDSNCAVYHPFDDSCFKCEDEYTLVNSVCHYKKNQIEHCTPYEQSVCKSCAEGFTLKDQKCVQESCLSMDNQGICSECREGFYLVKQLNDSTSGLSKSTCVKHSHQSNCSVLDKTKDQCKVCSKGYHLFDNKCVESPNSQNCKMMETNQNKCSECSMGFVLSSEGTCNPDNCERRDRHGKCEECEENYTLHLPSRKCEPQIDRNCLVFDSEQGICSRCRENFFLNSEFGNICYEVSKVPNCEKYLPDQNECERCLNYFYLEDKVCKKIHSLTHSEPLKTQNKDLLLFKTLFHVFLVLFCLLLVCFIVFLFLKKKHWENFKRLFTKKSNNQNTGSENTRNLTISTKTHNSFEDLSNLQKKNQEESQYIDTEAQGFSSQNLKKSETRPFERDKEQNKAHPRGHSKE